MKKISIITLLFFISSSIFAQTGDNKRKRPDKEQVQAMKIAYITNKLMLTPEEAQKFWPVYNEYTTKRDAIRKEMRKNSKANYNKSELSDEEKNIEIAKNIEKNFELRYDELKLDKLYFDKFIDVLPIKKVGELYTAEHEFKRELLRRMKKKNAAERESPPPHPAH